MNKPTKAEVRDAIRLHEESLRNLKQAILTNDGSKVAKCLDGCSTSYDGIVDLLEQKYPDSFETDEEETEEGEEGEEGEEEEEEEEEEDEEGLEA
jgi:hypothetical protein